MKRHLDLKLIFLTYINRSGSTFLANLFSKSPEVLVCPEGESLMDELLVEPNRPFSNIKETRKRLLRVLKEDPKLKVWRFSDLFLDELPANANNFEIFISFLGDYRDRIKPDANIILFKAERLIHLFDRLMQLPADVDIVYISIIRDCRGVYASQKRTKFPDSRKWMSRNPVRTAIQWSIHVRKAVQLKDAGNLILIKFEDLISNYNLTFPELLKNVGISTVEIFNTSGDLFDRIPETHKMIHQNINSGPISGKATEWKFAINKNEQTILETISAIELKKLGYNIEGMIHSVIVKIMTKYYYLLFYYFKIKKKFQYLLTRKK